MRQKQVGGKYQLTDQEELLATETENLHCLLIIKLIEKHNGKNHKAEKHRHQQHKTI